MPETRTRLIETAVRPLADDAEMKLAAAHLLGELVKPDAEGAEEAIQRWEALDTGKRKQAWRILLFSILVILSALIWADGVKALTHRRSSFGWTSYSNIFYDDPALTSGKVTRRLTDRQRLLLYGETEGLKSDKAKALWDSEPTNPRYFAEYAACYYSEHGKTLPPDFLETARRIDPQNAWFTYVAAGVMAKDAVKKRDQTKAEKAANKSLEWDVLDQNKMADALALFHQARNQPQCASYEMEVLRQQLQLLPGRTPPEVMHQITFICGRSSSLEINMRALAEVIAAQAWLDGETNNLPGLRELIADSDDFLQKRTRSEVGSLLGELINTVAASAMISNLSPAADKLGLAGESARLKEIFGRVLELKARKESKKRFSNADLLYKKGSELAGMFSANTSSSVKNPPELTDGELRPGRLVDHEVLSRVCCYLTWTILIVAMGLAAAFRYRLPVLIRRLAGRMESLMRPSDWIWILAGGVFLPFFYVMGITRLSAWGGRELGIEYLTNETPMFNGYNWPLEFSQFVALAVLMILVSVRIARWRLAKRMAVFGFRQKWGWLGWTAIVCAAAFVPLLGWAVTQSSDAGVYVAFYVAAVTVFWLLAACFHSFHTSAENLLQNGVIARTLIPTFAMGAILMMVAVPYFKAAAYHWFEQDQFMKPDLVHPSLTKFEYKVAVQMRKELREILGYQP